MKHSRSVKPDPAPTATLPEGPHPARSGFAPAGEAIALAAILTLAAYLRFDSLADRSLWLDEFSTWHVSRLPLGQSLIWGPELTIPPLYQFLLRLLTADPRPPEWVLRLPAAVAGLAAVAAAWWLGRTLAGAAAGCALAALIACHPLQIEYSREARPYSLLVLGCTLSTAVWYRLISTLEKTAKPAPCASHAVSGRCTGSSFAYVAAATLAYYSHYVALFTIAAHVSWWATRLLRPGGRSLRTVPLAALAGVALLCAPLVLRTWLAGRPALRQLSWIEPAGASAAWRMLEQIGFGGVWIVALTLAAGSWGLARLGWLRGDLGQRLSQGDADRPDCCPLLLGWLGGSWLGLLVVSWLVTPLTVTRYFLPAAVPALLLPITVAGRLRPAGGVALAVFVATASWPAWWASSVRITPGMRELVAFLEANVDPRHEAVALAIYDDPNEAELERLALRYYPLEKVPVHELHLKAAPGGVGDAILRDPRAIYLVLFLGDPQPRLEAAGRHLEPIMVGGESYPLLLFTQYRLVRVAPVRLAP
jgi:hypothetical protein